MAATAESVLKPDFKTQPQALHLHRRARTAARVDPQLRDQRARARTPRNGRRRRSRTRSSGAWASSASSAWTSPSSTAGRAATTTRAWCSPRRSRTPTPAAWRWAIAVQTDMAMPPILAFGTEEQKQEWVVPAIKGEKILCLGITEPDAGSDVVRDQDARGPRRRGLRDQRLEDLHHQRPPRRRDRARHQDRPRRRLRRLHAVPRADGRARRDPREEAREARHARLRHRAARLPGRARARLGGARPGGQGLLPHHVGAPGRAPDRRRGLRRGRAEMLRANARSTPTSARPSARASATSR